MRGLGRRRRFEVKDYNGGVSLLEIRDSELRCIQEHDLRLRSC